MKVVTKKLYIFAISAMILVGTTFYASASTEGWIKSNRWWYQNADESYKANEWSCIDGKWYHFDKEGWMQSDWFQDVDSKWYYLDNSGAMKTGWFQDTDSKWYYLDNSGAMKTGWFQDADSKWYYLDNSGAMQTASKYINSLLTSKSPATNTPPATPEKETPVNTAPIINSTEYNTGYENEVIRLVNKEGVAQGLSALGTDSKLTQAARIRAKEIVNLFDHKRPTGESFFTVFTEANLSVRMGGENIAEGYSSPDQVMTGWMNSSGHRENILKSGYEKIGVACFELNGREYWVQLFISE
ncbi:MAG: hypothetical protein GX913_06480 [Clostridiales bacterium]|nr:hypothetical protein [Clostridiales bacterium]